MNPFLTVTVTSSKTMSACSVGTVTNISSQIVRTPSDNSSATTIDRTTITTCGSNNTTPTCSTGGSTSSNNDTINSMSCDNNNIINDERHTHSHKTNDGGNLVMPEAVLLHQH